MPASAACTTSPSSVLAQKLSQVDGVGQVKVGGGALPAVRVELNPNAARPSTASASIRCATVLGSGERQPPEGPARRRATAAGEIDTTDQLFKAAEYQPLVVAYRNGAAVRLADVGEVDGLRRGRPHAGLANGKPAVPVAWSSASRAPTSSRPSTASGRCCRSSARCSRRRSTSAIAVDRTTTIRASVARRRADAAHLDRAGDPGGVRVPAQRLGHAHPERRGAAIAGRHVRRRCTCSATASTTCR